MNGITLDNLDQFSVDFDSSPISWWFRDNKGSSLPTIHKSQIEILENAAARYLWDFEMYVNDKPLRDVTKLELFFRKVKHHEPSDDKPLKKWLYETGIPFQQNVYMSLQPDTGFVLTWKMLIRYSANIFFGQEFSVWDKSLNWLLVSDRDHKVHFAINRIEKH